MKLIETEYPPVFLNTFEVKITWPEEITSTELLDGQITSFFEKDYRLKIEFNENIDPMNKMIVLPTIVKIKAEWLTIPEIKVSLYNHQGDIFMQTIYTDCEIEYYERPKLDYTSQEIFHNIVTLKYERCEVLFV